MRIVGKSLAQVAVIGLLAVLTATGCHSTSKQSSHQKKEDKAAVHSVKEALANDSVYKYPDVTVTAKNGIVQLSGFAHTQDQRKRAEELSANAAPGHQVIDNIVVQPLAPTGRATIIDQQGRETGRVMLNTNAPAPAPSGTTP